MSEPIATSCHWSEQRGSFQLWLSGLPADSLDRLRTINLNTSSSRHIILALAFGLCDRNIRRINRMITSLLLARIRAERGGKTRQVERINAFMDEVHLAVDLATGTAGLRKRHQNMVCGRSQSSKIELAS